MSIFDIQMDAAHRTRALDGTERQLLAHLRSAITADMAGDAASNALALKRFRIEHAIRRIQANYAEARCRVAWHAAQEMRVYVARAGARP